MRKFTTDKPAASRRRGGFTLVEVLLALAVAVLLIGGAAVAIGVASRTMEVNDIQGEFSQSGRMILGRLTGEVRDADAVAIVGNALRITPSSAAATVWNEYELTLAGLVYRQHNAGGTTTHMLVDSGDGIVVSSFEAIIDPIVVEGVSVAGVVRVRLSLAGGGDSATLTASARLRKNLPW